jgi:2-dehydro-3-deoxygluconokinase
MRLGYGGDTLNTAVYLARLGVTPEYVTALGDDHYSDWLIDCWRAEGVQTNLVYRLAGRVPGLYMIDTDPDGERHFSYWRQEAPARQLFDDEERIAGLERRLAAVDLVYLSGITLSLYPPAARERLFALLARLRETGVRMAFDGNYRPTGWPQQAQAREAFTRACSLADIVLPTFDDEQALFGDPSPEATLQRIAAGGAGEVVVKQGAAGCHVWHDGELVTVPASRVAQPIDTTAAGDSFNAGYLAGRLLGAAPAGAAGWGHTLAAAVIQVRGAILSAAQMPVLAP